MEIQAKIRGLLLRGAVLVGVLIALTLFINLSWFDEPLHPDLAAIEPARPVAMDDDSYPSVYGFLSEDPRAAGLAIVEKLRERYRSGETIALAPEEMDAILGEQIPDEAWQGDYPSLDCHWRMESGCAERLIAEASAAGVPGHPLSVMLDHYEALLDASRFEENQEFDIHTNVPPYGQVIAAGRIRLAVGAAHASTPKFLSDLDRDVRFWKGMLRDGQTLIAKMVALAGLGNDVAFTSAVMRQRDLDRDALRRVAEILEPLTEEERDIGEAFLAELRIVMLSQDSFGAAHGLQTLLTGLTSQRNATLNEYYAAMVMPLRLRASLTAREFYEQGGNERLSYNLRVFPPPLYNLGGKLELKQMSEGFSLQDYVTRVHDLDGRISLALLQAEIEASPGRSVEDVARASSHRNPYTGASMDYDAGKRTIGFECLSSSNDICRYAISRPAHPF